MSEQSSGRELRGMTLESLQRIVLKLANQTPVRYWVQWNSGNERQSVMALAFVPDGMAIMHELVGLGFLAVEHDGDEVVFTVPRINSDGTPYISNL